MSHLIALTGPRGAGKTTACQTLIAQARAANWAVAGLLSPAVVTDGLKTGIMAEDLQSGETRLLAQSAVNASESGDDAAYLRFGRWLFDRAVLDWGNAVLATAVPCDLLIVDELGPLELLHGSGWVNGLAWLRLGNYRQGVVVIRPELVAAAQKTLPIAQVIDLAGTMSPIQQAQVLWQGMG
ncbi:MAG: hypothetical protein HND44_13040 [Chloroflexi bacterium]|nr:hypothetical protein [Ardenticatenaceae bacterium]MBL1129404.1 hypothetical protein [Chloroflexota bacterium]NOG35484.1 hypothetical protein [Chloroflexota bacterium]GIK57433.1 MAG: hypothetical protein BroJett015_30960 [Chloroflexota bacterium]